MYDSVAIFGAGVNGKKALAEMILRKITVDCFIDNYKAGAVLDGIPVVSLNDYIHNYKKTNIVVAVSPSNQSSIIKQLDENELNYSVFRDVEIPVKKERIISYSHPNDREDVILYNLFKNDDQIFYIDVGCNDPFLYSVTKLLYDSKEACGIDIDPIYEMIETTHRERPRDICICAGIGEYDDEKCSLFFNGGNGILQENGGSENLCQIYSLKTICDKYIKRDQIISFLKIDVEGFEKKVLLGADLINYRPIIILIESTLPNTMIPCFSEWEQILIDSDYHFVFEYGVNRYYVANEYSEYDDRFVCMEDLKNKYYIVDALLIPSI